MAGIIYELIDVLEEQKECYEGLNQLAKYKEQAVVSKEISFLEEVTNTEEQFIGRLSILDKKREVLMKDISMVTGMREQEVTVTAIAEKLKGQEEVTRQLIKVRNEIKEQLEELKRQSELNKEVIGQSLEFVDFMVNAIGGMKGFVHAASYNRPGEEIPLQRQNSTFDYKQ